VHDTRPLDACSAIESGTVFFSCGWLTSNPSIPIFCASWNRTRLVAWSVDYQWGTAMATESSGIVFATALWSFSPSTPLTNASCTPLDAREIVEGLFINVLCTRTNIHVI